MTLKKYREKRDFEITTEPSGEKKQIRKIKKARFVVQMHAASHLHYDFRLEMDGVLKSWAVPKGPSLDPSVKRLAVHVEDHPLEYQTFEGIIPPGQYGAGAVIVWDRGTWKLESETKKGYAEGHFTFSLSGKKLKGMWKLVMIKNDPKNWLLIKVNDDFANKKGNIIEDDPLSVKSGKSIEEIIDKYLLKVASEKKTKSQSLKPRRKK